jgi:hypothetical protein
MPAAVMNMGRPAVFAALAMTLAAGCSSSPKQGSAPRELALEMGEISRSYDYYNNHLKKLDLPDPSSAGLLSMFTRPDTDSLKRYYTQEKSQKYDKCHSDSQCRKSDIMQLRAHTLSTYRVVKMEQIDDKKVKLVIYGVNPGGAQRKVTMDWVLERGRWRIDDVVSASPAVRDAGS